MTALSFNSSTFLHIKKLKQKWCIRKTNKTQQICYFFLLPLRVSVRDGHCHLGCRLADCPSLVSGPQASHHVCLSPSLGQSVYPTEAGTRQVMAFPSLTQLQQLGKLHQGQCYSSELSFYSSSIKYSKTNKQTKEPIIFP